MPKLFILVLLAAFVAFGSFLYMGKLDRYLPDSLFALIHGRPSIKLDLSELRSSGAGLHNTYRSKWLASFAARVPEPTGGRVFRLCGPADLRGDCDFWSLAAAFLGVQDGDVLVLSPGIYEEAAVLAANGITIRAEPGAHIKGQAIDGKAALVIDGDDTVIEGLECSGIKVRDRNGACIRLQGHNLTLSGVYFHDSEQGILTGQDKGQVIVQDSLFERLGAGGKAHAIYMGGGPDSVLIVRRVHIISSKDQGHGVKSRAVSTIIEDSVIASLGGVDSRLIDLPNGGMNVIRGNILQNGPNSANQDMIGIGLELKAASSNAEAHRSIVTGNIMILDRAAGNSPLHTRHVPAVEFSSNVIIGGRRDVSGHDNYWFRSRSMAGLANFPAFLE